jgi:hypothetical protein
MEHLRHGRFRQPFCQHLSMPYEAADDRMTWNPGDGRPALDA